VTKAQLLLDLLECLCKDDDECACEDNTAHVIKDAELDEPTYVPDDKNTSGQVSDELGIRMSPKSTLYPFKVQKVKYES